MLPQEQIEMFPVSHGMNVKARKFFLWVLAGVFVIGGAYLIISAQGLVFDFRTFQFLKTGGIYLNYSPKDAEVDINGQAHEYANIITNLFTSGMFISNLTPGSYNIKVSYPGFSPWEKNLEVRPGIVTAASAIGLWPTDWNAKKISDLSVSNFWLTGNGLMIKDTKGNLFFGDQKIGGSSVALNDENKSSVVISDGIDFYFIDLRNPTSSVPLSLPPGAVIKKWFYHPFDQNALVAAGTKYLYSVSETTGISQRLYAVNGNRYSYKNGNEIIVAQNDGTLFAANLILRTTATMKTGLNDGISAIAGDSGNILYLTDLAGQFYEYDRSSGTSTPIKTISGIVSKIYPSFDNDRLALTDENGTLSVLAVNDYKRDYQVERGTAWKIQTAKPVSDFLWLPSALNYGVLLENGSLVVSEMDGRAPQNQYLIDRGVTKMLLSGTNLYYIKNNSLFGVSLAQK